MDREQQPSVSTGTLPDPAVVKLQQQWEPLARRLAHRFAGSTECDDLEQIARLALWQAAQRFDPARGSSFFTFAVPTVIGSLRRYIRDWRLAVRIPRCWWEGRPHLKRMADALTQALEREPNVTELATQLGMSEEDVAGAMCVQDLLFPVSLDELHEGPKGEETEALAERIGAIDSRFEAAELRITVRQAMERLPSDLRDILDRRYFQELPPQVVARQLGMSQAQILRRERRALAWLRQELREAFGPGPKRSDDDLQILF